MNEYMNEITTQTTLHDTIDTHLRAYAEPDPTLRADLIGQVWAADGRLFDPPFDGTGPAAITALGDVLLQHYPAHRFERTTAVDEHHGFARYGWALIGPDGAAAVTGTDIATVGDDGRLAQVVGFFGDPAPV
jgi:hypothetical protein